MSAPIAIRVDTSDLKIGPGFCLHHNPYMNFLINLRDNELAGNPSGAHIKSSGSPVPIFWASSCGFTPDPTPDAARNPAIGRYTNNDLQRSTKLMLDSFL